MFVKLFPSMFNGSLYGKKDELLVFTYLLAAADVNGEIDIHPSVISSTLGMQMPDVKAALLALESPDPESRTPDEEGRRIVRLDAHREWGWRLVNYEKYRQIRHAEDRREQNRESSRRYRNRFDKKPKLPGTVRTPGQQRGYIYYAYSKANGIKIGFSANPWARLNEMRTASPDIRILATERGSIIDEKELHKRFKSTRIAREWFVPSQELVAHISEIEDLTDGAAQMLATMTSAATSASVITTTTTSAHAEAEAEAEAEADKDSVGGVTTPKDSPTLPQLYTEQEFTRPLPKRPDEPKIEPALERISVDLSGEIPSIKHFAVEVRDRARELTTAFAFRAYGSLPNLTKPIMQQAALHIATTIDAYGEQATQRWKDYFASPPPQHPKDLAPWHIRAYLGLDPAKPSAMFESLDAKQTESADREKMLDIIRKKRTKGRSE